jgi:hypothetical protein
MADETSFEGLTLQLAMGFGQGAGVLLATEEALMTALGAYKNQLRDIGERWESLAVQTIEYSRTMGSLSAHHALSDGRCVIDVGDVQYALTAVARNTVLPLGVCKIS